MLAIYIRSRRKWKSRRPISDKCTEAEAGLKRSMINAQKHYTLRKKTLKPETGNKGNVAEREAYFCTNKPQQLLL